MADQTPAASLRGAVLAHLAEQKVGQSANLITMGLWAEGLRDPRNKYPELCANNADRVVYRLLEAAERDGIVERDGYFRGPWLWKITPLGRVKLKVDQLISEGDSGG